MNNSDSNIKLIIITAPSGSGKTTIIKQLLQQLPQLAFSISACTRSPRTGEVDGKDYYFLTQEDFLAKTEQDEFVEWEMVYAGKYYGTLKSELGRITENGQIPLIDIDVVGALNVKKKYKNQALSIFIKAPSLAILKERLEKRGTETLEQIEERVNKAAHEYEFGKHFDVTVVNDKIEDAVSQVISSINNFIRI